MSWIWSSDPTTDQAQTIVAALEEELDERQQQIESLESVLKKEQELHSEYLQRELRDLEDRKKKLKIELAEVDSLINYKTKVLSGEVVHLSDATPSPVNPNQTASHLNGAQQTSELAPQSAASSNQPRESQPVAPSLAPAEEESVQSDEIHSKSETESKGVMLEDVEEVKEIRKIDPNVAFIIQRSLNSNTVVYAANVLQNGILVDRKPVDVYWIMFENEGNPREELNMIERNSAYGISTKPIKGRKGEYEVSISSLKDRVMHFSLNDDGVPLALTTINGKPKMRLQRVYVCTKSGWGLPTVLYVELFGFNPLTGEPVYEKKVN